MHFLIIITLSLLNFFALVAGSSPVVIGYWTDWTADKYPVSSIPWSKLTHINYAFGLFTNQDWKIKIHSPQNLRELVTRSKPTDTKILVSIGGWTGSKHFSPMVASATNRAIFIKNAVDFVKNYKIDGIDLDWEYPGREGEAGNLVSPQDSANYLIFLKELKAALPKGTLITAAAYVKPFDGPNGPLKDVSAFAQYFDFINIMSYDLNGPWSRETGPVGGLDYQPGKGVQLSIKQSVSDWSQAGFPKNKMVIGVPFYGYQLGVSADMSKSDSQYAPITNKNFPSVPYNALIRMNILTSSNQANSAKGWIRKFDSVTKTPWLFNKNTKTFIAYDDPTSIALKAEFSRCNGYRGIMAWALDNDYDSELLTAMQGVKDTGPCSRKSIATNPSKITSSSIPNIRNQPMRKRPQNGFNSAHPNSLPNLNLHPIVSIHL